MKKIVSLFIMCVLALSAYAVPAMPGWQTRTQADGSTIEVQVIGDEFYHYTINREGKELREVNGMFKVVGEAPSPAEVQARHEAARTRHYAPVQLPGAANKFRAPKAIGTTPNLAPRGIVILVNFSDSHMDASHTQAVFDELCNSTDCQVNINNNKKYPSAAQFFADQSNGSYRPIFDVYGPVTLDYPTAHYGTDLVGEQAGSDSLATDAVIEACMIADQQYDIDWSNYDSDNDGAIDFVYMMFAGKGQAAGGASYTIWPHNWTTYAAMYYGRCSYEWGVDNVIDGLYIYNYACSAELTINGGLTGIGTLCHEFGHVMGLPDLYDIKYGDVYASHMTPNTWNIMDGGSYNGGEHCPPNYDPWQKYFFGWQIPVNLGTTGNDITLKPVGTEGATAYQINASGTQMTPTTKGLSYYIENRQQTGWDEYTPAHGLLLWKADFNADYWKANTPNSTGTPGAPRHTVVSADPNGYIGLNGTCTEVNAAGYCTHREYSTYNTFPGSSNVTEWTALADRTLTDITEATDGTITLKYNGGYVPTFYTFGVVEPQHCTVSQMGGYVSPNDPLSLTFTPDEGYTLDDAACWLAYMGEANLPYGTGFTFNAETGEFLIPQVTGDVVILVAAKKVHTITWYAKSEEFAQSTTTGLLTLPTAQPEACTDGRTFVGWTALTEYENAKEAPTYVQNGEEVHADAAFYAVFAEDHAGKYRDFTTSCTPVEHKYYSIRFFDNGTQIGDEQSVLEGDQPNIPEEPTAACDAFVFFGWWTAPLAADNTAALSIDDFTATQDQDYHAVYRRAKAPKENAGTLVTFKPGEDNSNTLSMTKNGVTVALTDGSLSRDDNYRCYADQTMTISATEPISQIVLSCVAAGDAQYGPGCFSTSTGVYTSNEKMGLWTGEAASVALQAEKQVRISLLEVTYGGKGATIYFTTTVNCQYTDIENNTVVPVAVKALRDGQIVIIRGDRIYTVTGTRIE